MGSGSDISYAGPSTSNGKPTPFAQVMVTLSKEAEIKLRSEANYWKSQHQQALARLAQREADHRLAMAQAAAREAALRSELEKAEGKLRDLQKRLFGRKSERRSRTEKDAASNDQKSARPRGQRPGVAGHGRRLESHLPAQVETIELDCPHCPECGLGYADFPGTEDSEILEIDVKPYRRVIRRRRYRRTCRCPGTPGILSAPPPARLIARGKYGVSIWVHLLLSKFSYGQPTHRLLRDWSDYDLTLSPGTLTGGLRALAPLFEPLEDALRCRLQSENRWHADETRWMVFAETEGKIGHRWYLWVFHSESVIHFVLDPTRSAQVPIAELSASQGGIVICDRYSGYKKLARILGTILLAFCWAHQRRDFIELANAHPELSEWALSWVERIGELYLLNDARLAVRADPVQWAARDDGLRQRVAQMANQREAERANPALKAPARKVLQSMQKHWSGLTVFVDHPEVPMDNNVAERDQRTPVVARKNFYGSGSPWSGALAATMFSLLMTMRLWGINPRTWLTAYLDACAANGSQPPADLSVFLPWAMDADLLAQRRRAAMDPADPIDSS
ncbi:transposase IS66 [Candidatus Accumulibacter phosphatis]|uniref:Transposase IS66 n=1 Tax=Accumulibacter regalis TaxID=522306 RepID=C7RJI1_ACCRE